jgi:predicted RNA binding protein YcfA (HicA-like mRNA interferase family)
MAKHLKSLEKLCATPTPSDVKWNDLKSILEHLGYDSLNNSGSRRKFYHKGKNALIICHAPHPSPNVDKGCIADVVDHLKSQGFIK